MLPGSGSAIARFTLWAGVPAVDGNGAGYRLDEQLNRRMTFSKTLVCAAGVLIIAFPGDVMGQTPAPEKVPLPIIGSRILPPQPGRTIAADALTAEEKARLALRNTFGTRALVNRLVLTGMNQWQDHPEEWPQGVDGFGQRFASRFGRLAVRNAIQLSVDVAMKTDPRYNRCDCDGFLPRAGHALKRVLVARTDYGGQTINASRLAGAYVTPMITDQWYPGRLNTWSHKLESGTWNLGWRGATNILREFWPEIRRTLSIKRRPAE